MKKRLLFILVICFLFLGNTQVNAATKNCIHQFTLTGGFRYVKKSSNVHVLQRKCYKCLQFVTVEQEKHSHAKNALIKYTSDKKHHTVYRQCKKCQKYIKYKQEPHIYNSQPVNRMVNGVCDASYHYLKMRCMACDYYKVKKEGHKLREIREPYYDSNNDKNLFYHWLHKKCYYCDYASAGQKEKHTPVSRKVFDAKAKTKHLQDQYYTIWDSSSDYIGQCRQCLHYCWQGSGYAAAAKLDARTKRIISKAVAATGIKYSLGGVSLGSGTDCSGLVWALLKECKVAPYYSRARFSTSDTSRSHYFAGATIQNLSADGGKTINPNVIRNLHIGDLIITPYPVPSKSHGSYGHIAIVIKANPDKLTFESIEAAGYSSGFGRVVHISNREYCIFGDYLVNGKYYTGQVIHWHP